MLPPGVSTHDGAFAVHIGQHLLLGMTGPAFLALSAPVTLALRALPRAPRRTDILRVLHSRPVTIVSTQATAVVLNLGGLYALYLTGLYSAAERTTTSSTLSCTCTCSSPAACSAGPSSASTPFAAAQACGSGSPRWPLPLPGTTPWPSFMYAA